jgi:hypothetical protein
VVVWEAEVGVDQEYVVVVWEADSPQAIHFEEAKPISETWEVDGTAAKVLL